MTGFAQTDVWVDDDACPGPGTGTPADPFCSIQDAICDIKDTGGGTVNVNPGTYVETIRMWPGVSVVATDGPAVTTIDGTGGICVTQSCTDNTTTTECSTVMITSISGDRLTPSDRLEGFRIIGGAGTYRDFGNNLEFVAGGGIFILNSSPTITNNEIASNVLATSQNKFDKFVGGGIYVHSNEANQTWPVAEPVITQNLIELNVANPPGGSGNSPTYGVGGGVYVGYWSAPVLTDNTIRNNRVGDSNVTNQIGAGGGVAIYTRAPAIPVYASRNMIVDNYSSDLAGGVYAGWTIDDASTNRPSIGTVEDSVIDYNVASSGGGVSAKYSNVKFRNNTIVENGANYGGGIYAGTSSVAEQTNFVNNLVVFNDATVAGTGGGIYVYQTEPIVRYNDLFGNIPEDVGGDKTDPDYVGVDGNIQQDPLLVNMTQVGRDLRLQTGSPAMEAGDNGDTSANDFDNYNRVQDGDNDGNATVDLGAYEFLADWDLDGIPDVHDPDDDNDGVNDASDCANFNRGVASPPGEPAAGLRVNYDPANATLVWPRTAQGHTYNVYRGTFDAATPWLYDETCFVTETPDNDATDTEVPAPENGYYYLVSAKNVCGETRAGVDSSGADIIPAAACSDLGADTDTDGLIDVSDNCPSAFNPDQGDGDGDFVGNDCDNCGGTPNADQLDFDVDGVGDVCDNCPQDANQNQFDGDTDTVGDVCDNCASVSNPGQEDNEGDGLGDVCDPDDDNDTVDDVADNCPLVANTGQSDVDFDGLGDACDICVNDADNDIDGDGICGDVDNCPSQANVDQANNDGDALGDVCDDDDDNDGVPDVSDCAPFDPSASAPPALVTGVFVDKAGNVIQVSWNGQGPGVVYDIASGLLGDVRTAGNVADATCLQDDEPGTTYDDMRPDPPVNEADYYLLRGQNVCGNSGYGTDSGGGDRLPTSDCP